MAISGMVGDFQPGRESSSRSGVRSSELIANEISAILGSFACAVGRLFVSGSISLLMIGKPALIEFSRSF